MKWQGTRRRWLQAVLGTAVTTGVYSWRVEPHWVEVVHRTLPIASLDSDWIGKKLVQISDIHAGPFVDDRYLFSQFSRVDGWAPDVVVYTGDFVSRGWTLSDDQLQRSYRNLPRGKVGTYGVLGNHDFGRDWREDVLAARLESRLRRLGIHVLRNETEDCRGLRIHGIDDLWGTQFDMAYSQNRISTDSPHLVLCHNPDVADLPVWGDHEGWILSGHTHGGQCRLPWVTSLVLPVRNTRYVAGEYAVGGGRRLYINRGLGYLARLRFAARPEITVFEFTQA